MLLRQCNGHRAPQRSPKHKNLFGVTDIVAIVYVVEGGFGVQQQTLLRG